MVKSCNTLEEMEQEILAAGDKLIVMGKYSFDDSCPPCNTMSKKFERLAFEEEDVVFLARAVIPVLAHRSSSSKMELRSMRLIYI